MGSLLELPSEPAFAMTARVFIVAAARQYGADARVLEDLRLAASELFTNALEHGAAAVRFSVAADDRGTVVRAEGVGSLTSSGAGETADVWTATRRLDVLATLVDDLHVIDDDPGTVEIHLPSPV
jgi:anti-sigma regulatory factor (Ser/Thr protein kinase)